MGLAIPVVNLKGSSGLSKTAFDFNKSSATSSAVVIQSPFCLSLPLFLLQLSLQEFLSVSSRHKVCCALLSQIHPDLLFLLWLGLLLSHPRLLRCLMFLQEFLIFLQG